MESLLFKYEKFLLVFLVIQPVIDVITTFSLVIEAPITFGLLFRMVVMILSLFYLFFKILDSSTPWWKHPVFWYFLISGIFLGINLIVSSQVKPIFSFGEEIRFLLKAFYFWVMLFCFYFLLKSHLEVRVEKLLFQAMILIGIFMVLSAVSGTGLQTYEYLKEGSNGWFYAGNEIGAIVAFGFPICIGYVLKQTYRKADWKAWVPIVLLIYTLLTLGTKVGYFSGLLSLTLLAIFTLWNSRRQQFWILMGLLAAYLLVTPFSAFYQNTNIDLKEAAKKNIQQTQKPELKTEEKLDQPIKRVVLSSRDKFLLQQKEYFAKASLIQKWVGMGFSGNYEKEPKMIEMDFHELFYSYGYFGFAWFLLPLILLVGTILRQLWNSIEELKNPVVFATGLSLVLLFGISFTAGHVLFAPAVSIYLAVFLNYLKIRVSQSDSLKENDGWDRKIEYPKGVA